jgi:large subunit ribosomal protein L16
MIGGKGEVEGYVAVVTPGTILVEIGGVSEEIAREALRLAGHKFSVKTKFVKRREI